MIVPNKFTPLDKSILEKLPAILVGLEECASIHDLYQHLESNFEDVGEFLYALDALYVLGVVELDPATETLRKC